MVYQFIQDVTFDEYNSLKSNLKKSKGTVRKLQSSVNCHHCRTCNFKIRVVHSYDDDIYKIFRFFEEDNLSPNVLNLFIFFFHQKN